MKPKITPAMWRSLRREAAALALLTSALAVGMLLVGCTVSVGPSGRPTIGVDPQAIVDTIAAWQARSGAKAATVVIIDSAGKELPAIPVTPTK